MMFLIKDKVIATILVFVFTITVSVLVAAKLADVLDRTALAVVAFLLALLTLVILYKFFLKDES